MSDQQPVIKEFFLLLGPNANSQHQRVLLSLQDSRGADFRVLDCSVLSALPPHILREGETFQELQERWKTAPLAIDELNWYRSGTSVDRAYLRNFLTPRSFFAGSFKQRTSTAQLETWTRQMEQVINVLEEGESCFFCCLSIPSIGPNRLLISLCQITLHPLSWWTRMKLWWFNIPSDGVVGREFFCYTIKQQQAGILYVPLTSRLA